MEREDTAENKLKALQVRATESELGGCCLMSPYSWSRNLSLLFSAMEKGEYSIWSLNKYSQLCNKCFCPLKAPTKGKASYPRCQWCHSGKTSKNHKWMVTVQKVWSVAVVVTAEPVGTQRPKFCVNPLQIQLLRLFMSLSMILQTFLESGVCYQNNSVICQCLLTLS